MAQASSIVKTSRFRDYQVCSYYGVAKDYNAICPEAGHVCLNPKRLTYSETNSIVGNANVNLALQATRFFREAAKQVGEQATLSGVQMQN